MYHWNYDGMYVPTFRFDGQYLGDPSDFPTNEQWYDFVRATFDSLLQVPSPIQINLDQYWSKDMDSVYVSFDVVCVGSVPKPLWLNFAVVEGAHFYAFKSINYAKRWYHAVRRMMPDAYGVPLDLSPGDSLHFDYVYAIDDVFHQDDVLLVDDQWDMETVVFVEDTTRVVLTDSTGAPVDTVTEAGQVYQAVGRRVGDVSAVRPGTPASELALSRNWPNPFTSETSIAYAVGKAGTVRLSVYTPEGRLVTRLVDGYTEPGTYSKVWDGRDRFGNDVGSGVYYYRLDLDGQMRTGRMVLLK